MSPKPPPTPSLKESVAKIAEDMGTVVQLLDEMCKVMIVAADPDKEVQAESMEDHGA